MSGFLHPTSGSSEISTGTISGNTTVSFPANTFIEKVLIKETQGASIGSTDAKSRLTFVTTGYPGGDYTVIPRTSEIVADFVGAFGVQASYFPEPVTVAILPDNGSVSDWSGSGEIIVTFIVRNAG